MIPMNHQWFRSESEHLRSACILVKASESLAGPWRGHQPMGHGTQGERTRKEPPAPARWEIVVFWGGSSFCECPQIQKKLIAYIVYIVYRGVKWANSAPT